MACVCGWWASIPSKVDENTIFAVASTSLPMSTVTVPVGWVASFTV